MANAPSYGVTTIKVGDRLWQTQDFNLPDWQETTPKLKNARVEITVR